MTEYRGDVPSLQLSPNDFEGLVEVMKNHTTAPELTIKVEEGGFTYKYNSADEMLDDPALPDVILDFSLRVNGEEGRCSLYGDSSNSWTSSGVSISGNDDWVKTKKSDFDQFLGNHKNTILTMVDKDRWKFPILFSIGAVSGALIGTFSNSELGFYSFLLVFVVLWTVGMLQLNKVYPYILIKRDESVVHRPYLRKVMKSTVTLLTIVGGSITVYRFIFGPK